MIDLSVIDRCRDLFSKGIGKDIKNKILAAIKDYNMEPLIRQGVLLGFSGGADSVLLLIFMRHICDLWGSSLSCVHVNHNIRGDAALRDEEFSRQFAKALGVEFISISKDIPTIAKENGLGLEEAARNERYGVFNDIIKERENLGCIAVAHNASDNSETFIFNLLRGSGSRGLKGIPAVRDNIIRPLIYVSKRDILNLLEEGNIPFVTDETNFSCDYSRNYIRAEILPKMSRLTPNVDRAISRAIGNIASDSDYLDGIAADFLEKNLKNSKIDASLLSELHISIFSRVLFKLASSYSSSPEKHHVETIFNLLKSGDNFSYDLPGGVAFYNSYKKCYIAKRKFSSADFERKLSLGYNYIPELNAAIEISRKKTFNSLNVYNFSIQTHISDDIIIEDLYVRVRREADSYRFGGMTRKLKKLFIDHKIPSEIRSLIPIICDSKGIIFPVGFPVRDSAKPSRDSGYWITIYSNEQFKYV